MAQKFYARVMREFRDKRCDPQTRRDLHALFERCQIPVDTANEIVGTIIATMHEVHQEHDARDRISTLLNGHATAIRATIGEGMQTVLDLAEPYSEEDEHALLDFGCGDGSLLTSEDFDDNERVLFDPVDYRTEDVRACGHTFTSTWDDIVRGVETNGYFDVAFAINALRFTNDPSLQLTRLRDVADRLILVERVPHPEDGYRPRQVAAVLDWVTTHCLNPTADIPHHASFHTAAQWHNMLVRSGWTVTRERDINDGILPIPGNYRLHVCEFR